MSRRIKMYRGCETYKLKYRTDSFADLLFFLLDFNIEDFITEIL